MTPENEKICPLVNGKCIGTACMGCKLHDHTKSDINGLIVHFEKYYTCKIFDVELDITEEN